MLNFFLIYSFVYLILVYYFCTFVLVFQDSKFKNIFHQFSLFEKLMAFVSCSTYFDLSNRIEYFLFSFRFIIRYIEIVTQSILLSKLVSIRLCFSAMIFLFRNIYLIVIFFLYYYFINTHLFDYLLNIFIIVIFLNNNLLLFFHSFI